jgi:hypothetical protein
MEYRRRQIRTIVATAAVGAVAAALAFGVAPRALADDATGSTPTATAAVVKIENRKAPGKKIVKRRFRPWAHPTPGQVREIISNEARRWGVSAAALSRRVACESHYHWWASNGQYQGVLQFSAGAFYRGVHTMRSHKVRIVRSKTRRVHDAHITHYADGRKTKRRTTPRRQRLVVVYKGRIPRSPAINNTFAQIRIGAQALRGISAVQSSEWSCGA